MAAKGRKRREVRQRGFTLIELLIVVAIIGIIAAIAIPNLLNAVDKGKQKRSMSDMRTICAAVEAYATDTAKYPLGASNWAALKPSIDPYFVRNPPDADGWANGWEASTTSNGSDYTVSSLGKDGFADARAGGPTSAFDCDIVYTNGHFFQWPQGTQS
jgi:general secretion pathway protein G